MEKLWSNLVDYVTHAGVNIVLGVVILIVGIKLSKFIIGKIGKGKGFAKLDKSIQSFIRSFLKVVLYALVISSVAILWGVPTASFITVFTSAGVAIGLALQGALSNFAGGLLILLFKPFKVGDFIENDGVSGTVKDITVIYTILTTKDNKVITIPNGTITNSKIINYSANSTRRVDLTISASYNDNIEEVKKLLTTIAAEHPKVLADPAPLVRLNKHNDSSLDYNFFVWVNAEDYWDVYFDLLEQVKTEFDKNGFSIPFKQIDIHQI